MIKFSSTCASAVMAFSLYLCMTTSAHAAVACVSADSDPDGDGWGWENEQSCQVVESSSPEPAPPPEPSPTPNSAPPLVQPSHNVCLSADSDPDGDGWGWENGASCLVQVDAAPQPQPQPEPPPEPEPPQPVLDPLMDVVPGQSVQTATQIPVGREISMVYSADSDDSHWYRFEVDSDVAVALRFLGTADMWGLDLYVNFVASGDNVTSMSLDPFMDSYEQSRVICVPPDEFYIRVDNFLTRDTEINYSFEVREAPYECTHPDYNDTAIRNFVTVIPDGYLATDNNDLIAYSHNGIEQWRLEGEFYKPQFQITEQAIYLAEDQYVYSLDMSGNLNWMHDLGDFYPSIHAFLVTSDSVYLATYNSLFALGLNGTPRWIASSNSYIESLHIADNGSLYVGTGNGVMVFNTP